MKRRSALLAERRRRKLAPKFSRRYRRKKPARPFGIFGVHWYASQKLDLDSVFIPTIFGIDRTVATNEFWQPLDFSPSVTELEATIQRDKAIIEASLGIPGALTRSRRQLLVDAAASIGHELKVIP